MTCERCYAKLDVLGCGCLTMPTAGFRTDTCEPGDEAADALRKLRDGKGVRTGTHV